MSIKRRFVRFDHTTCMLVVFFDAPFSLSPSIINYACPHFQATCAMVPQHDFELSTILSIPSNGHVGGLCEFLFHYHSPKRLSCFVF